MSSCLSGVGGRAYGFDFNLVKSPSTSTITSHTSSPSSAISESSNSQLAISNRKPRTARKRLYQTYDEAVFLLSTACPNLFSSKNIKKPGKFTKPTDTFSEESSELLLNFPVFDSPSFLLHQIQHKPSFAVEPKVVNLQEKQCQSPGEISSRVNSLQLDDDFEEDFDAESVLDEEIEEGIDSIIGSTADDGVSSCEVNPWSENCFGGKDDFRQGLGRTGARALRHVDEVNWWNFPTVDVLQISSKITKPLATVSTEKKKKKKVERTRVDSTNLESLKENWIPKSNQGFLLKLNYDEVLNAWSDKTSPFAVENPSSDVTGNDIATQLAVVDLFREDGGVREAMRYEEKRRTRLFPTKIRYQVRKVNEDRQSRMKQGRFVRWADSISKGKRL